MRMARSSSNVKGLTARCLSSIILSPVNGNVKMSPHGTGDIHVECEGTTTSGSHLAMRRRKTGVCQSRGGRRMPDLDLVTSNRPTRVFSLLNAARPVLLNLDVPGSFDITRWASRVELIDAKYDGPWELPVLGTVTAPSAALIRPDGYVAWVGDGTQRGLTDALTTWFGPPAAA